MSGENRDAALRPLDPRRAVHGYDGVEHTQPGPFGDCLLCRLDALTEAATEAHKLLRALTRDVDFEEHFTGPLIRQRFVKATEALGKALDVQPK